MTVELTEDDYKSTMSGSMLDVTQTAEPVLDIWPFVKKLNSEKIVPDYTFKNELVETVYRNKEQTFDHVLLPTADINIFIVIIVDLVNENIKGYRRLDLNKEYGLK